MTKQRDKQLLDKERIDKQRRKPLYGSNSQATTNVARQRVKTVGVELNGSELKSGRRK